MAPEREAAVGEWRRARRAGNDARAARAFLRRASSIFRAVNAKSLAQDTRAAARTVARIRWRGSDSRRSRTPPLHRPPERRPPFQAAADCGKYLWEVR